MRTFLDGSRRPRVLLAVVAAVTLAFGGIVGGVQVASGSDDAGPSTAQDRAAELAHAKAVIAAGAHEDVLADGAEFADRVRAALLAADHKVDDGLRAQAMTTLTALEGAIAADDYPAVLAAMPPAREAFRLLEDAARAFDVAAGRGATQAERARVAAEQDAQRMAAEQATRAAAKQGAARAAADQGATPAAAEQGTAPAESDAAASTATGVTGSAGAAEPPDPAAPGSPAGAGTVSLAGTFTLLGWALPGAPGATLVVDESTGQCLPVNGYEDIRPGAAVTVYDPQGAVLATTTLGSAETTVVERVGGTGAASGLIVRCSFPFSASVPERPSYEVEVTHRGRVTIPLAGVDDVRAGL